MNLSKLTIIVCLPLVAAACKRGEDYVVLPAYHPAEPSGQSGVPLRGVTALQPELRSVSADVSEKSQSTPAPAAPSQHQH